MVGEAKRRRLYVVDPRACPSCHTRSTVSFRTFPALLMSHIETLYGFCTACEAIWEAIPRGMSWDVCDPTAEPCDNCAFRPGAPEHKNRPKWGELLAKLKAGGEFKCHKGAPIMGGDIPALRAAATGGGGMAVGFDEEWINKRARGCVGFWRMIWATGAKDPEYDWIKQRYNNAFVCGNSDVAADGP